MHPCIYLTFVSYYQKSSNCLNLVSLWFFDEFLNLYLKFLSFKPISHLTMVYYHQNPIGRTLGLTHPYFPTPNIHILNHQSLVLSSIIHSSSHLYPPCIIFTNTSLSYNIFPLRHKIFIKIFLITFLLL